MPSPEENKIFRSILKTSEILQNFFPTSLYIATIMIFFQHKTYSCHCLIPPTAPKALKYNLNDFPWPARPWRSRWPHPYLSAQRPLCYLDTQSSFSREGLCAHSLFLPGMLFPQIFTRFAPHYLGLMCYCPRDLFWSPDLKLLPVTSSFPLTSTCFNLITDSLTTGHVTASPVCIFTLEWQQGPSLAC